MPIPPYNESNPALYQANGSTVCDSNFTVAWFDVDSSETNYHIQFSWNDPSFATGNIVYEADLAANTTTFNFNINTIPANRRNGRIYWRVDGVNIPCYGSYQGVADFVYLYYLETPYVTNPADCEQADSSANHICVDPLDCGMFVQDRPARIIWNPVVNAFDYNWELYKSADPAPNGALTSTPPAGSTLVASGNVSGGIYVDLNFTTSAGPLEECTIYYVRVQAHNGLCPNSAWSSCRRFKTDSNPPGNCPGC